MAKMDLHKLALTVGFEVVCVDDDYTNYEYMITLRDIESMSYVLKIKNEIAYSDIEEILQSIILVLPTGLRFKIKRLARKRDESNIDNIIDLLCFTVEEYKQKTRYNLLNEYAKLLGINLEENGYFFSYKMSKKRYKQIMAFIESKLDISVAPIIGKMHKIEYKIGYLKQHKKIDESTRI